MILSKNYLSQQKTQQLKTQYMFSNTSYILYLQFYPFPVPFGKGGSKKNIKK